MLVFSDTPVWLDIDLFDLHRIGRIGPKEAVNRYIFESQNVTHGKFVIRIQLRASHLAPQDAVRKFVQKDRAMRGTHHANILIDKSHQNASNETDRFGMQVRFRFIDNEQIPWLDESVDPHGQRSQVRNH